MNEIISRADARAAELSRYRTGKPCKHGHVAERYVSTGICCACPTEHRARNRDAYLGHQSRSREKNKEAIAEYQARYYEENKEALRERAARHRAARKAATPTR